MLAGFRGYMIADAASVYHELYRNEPDLIEAGRWSHARRRLFDALAVRQPMARDEGLFVVHLLPRRPT